MKFLDLFAGVGGIRLGMEQAGHECVGWVEWDKFARKSYQAIHDTTNEWTETDINNVKAEELPQSDIWCFGFPCQDISVAGKQGGFTNGKRSSLFFTVTGLIRQLKEEDRPSYLFIENVKNLLSINKGWDFAKLLIEMDEIGYDVEWDVLDSAEVVPQHRERIFIIGHLRGRSTREVFPIIREDGKTNNTVKQVGNLNPDGSFGGNPQVGRVYGTDGISPTLSTMQGGGQEPKIMVKDNKIDMVIGSTQKNASITDGTYSPTLTSAMGMGGGQTPLIVKHSASHAIRKLTPLERKRLQGSSQEPKIAVREAAKIGYDVAQLGDSINFAQPNSKTRRGRVGHGVANTLTTTMEQATLTGDFKIRKLTPKECWRLQGFPDWAFDRAREAGLSDSQLYKQAGNSVTVPVIKAIAERLSEEEEK